MLTLNSNLLRPALAGSILLLGFLAAALQLGPVWAKLAPVDMLREWLPAQSGQVAVVPFLVVIALTCTALLALLVPDRPPAEPAGTPTIAAPQPQEVRAAAAEPEEELSNNLDRILGLLNSHSELSRVYSLTLEHAGRNLIESTSPEQLRIAIGFLVAENNKMRKETGELQSNLRDSQERIEMLRSNLHHAEVTGMRDALTGVWNRRAFDTMIDQQVAQSPLRNRALSLAMVDIDHFKQINDKFGHQIGDEVLKLVASTLQRNLKGRDFVARYGGEEFSIILPQTQLDSAVKVAQQIREQLAKLRYVSPQHNESIGSITASFGVVQLKPSEGKRSFIQRADSKLYEAKHSGRNRVCS
jgi:diguanylate cyclase